MTETWMPTDEQVALLDALGFFDPIDDDELEEAS